MVVITDDIGQVVEALREPIVDPNAKGAGSPYYMFGHRREINTRLLEKSVDMVFKYQRYPLIALACPIAEEIDGDVMRVTLNIAILSFTDKNYNSEERMENVFKPVLYPLYEDLLEAIKNSGLFMWSGNQDRPPHRKVDRFYYGTQGAEGTEASVFSDPLDAIEIIDLKLNRLIKSNIC